MIRLFKLVNNDEIIGELIDNTSSTTWIKNPLILESKIKDGSMGFILNKYLPFNKDEIVMISSRNFISIVDISDDMIKYYQLNVEYIKNEMEPSIAYNIKKGLRYFESNLTSFEEDMTEDDYLEELLKELEPPSKTKN